MRAQGNEAETNGAFRQLKELILGDERRELSALHESLVEKELSLAELRSDLEERRRELSELRGSLHSQEGRLADLVEGFKERGTQISALREALESAQGERAELRDGLAEKERRLTDLRDGLEEKGTQISALREAVESAQRERAELGDGLAEQEGQLRELRSNLETKSAEISGLREDLQESESRISGLHDELESARRERAELRDGLEQEERALTEVRENFESERRAYHELRGDLEKEQEHLNKLRAHLEDQEANSVERLAGDLAAALRRRKELGPGSFDELVAAMQAGTESAIQRSVSKDKQPLTRALFPIMGPAIRNYVMDLFRSMVEELNKTIQNATSVERLKWRAQAKLAGKPYSEYVLLKTRSFRIEEVYLMQRDTGLLLLHCAMNPEDEARGEADLVSGMFTAIRSFVRDSFARSENPDEGAPSVDQDEEELDSFTFGEREVLIEVGPSLVLAAVARGVPAPSVRDELKRILENLHAELQTRLDQFAGDTAELEESRPTLREALIENVAEREGESGGGGFWRAWAALAVLALGIAAWIFVGAREQHRWKRFEDALRAQPGIAVTEVKDAGWWRRREVRGIRDPLAADPATLAGEYGIDLDKTSFDFGLMESLEPALMARRAAMAEDEKSALRTRIEDMRAEIETLRGAQARSESEALARAAEASGRAARSTESLVRSLFSDIPGLEIEFTGDRIRFEGDLAEDEFRLVLSRLEPLKGLGAVDTSGLSNDTGRRIAALLQQISSASIPYRGGTLEQEDRERFQQLARLLGELREAASRADTSYTFTILAHPLIGTNRAANRLIEEQRAEQVRQQLLGEGFDRDILETRLSEDLARAGHGVTVLPTERSTDQ